MRKSLLGAAALLLAASNAAMAGELSGGEIQSLLSGNSIVSPEFGCLFYSRIGKTVTIDFAGNSYVGNWSVEGDRYHSSGSCGGKGCSISGTFPDITFRRDDGRYNRSVRLVKGNYCEKNVVLS
jgi:hypothetical protein